jgi:hypothetical protein
MIQQAIVEAAQRLGYTCIHGSPQERVKAEWAGVAWAEFLPKS